ncbi:MAG: glutathione S-transferase [Pseudomonadota bacterium]
MSSELLLYLYDYNYSSWSMRAGLAVRQTGAPFREVNARAENFAALKELTPSGRFPALQHGTQLIWDSLAIGEYLNELYPEAGLWPAASGARAHARSMCAEMHSSFATMRDAMPMNLRTRYPGHMKTEPVRRDIARISEMWQTCLERYSDGGPFLFNTFTLADAFFAPVVMRFWTYDVGLSPALEAYAAAVREQAFVKDWRACAALDRHVNPAYDLGR